METGIIKFTANSTNTITCNLIFFLLQQINIAKTYSHYFCLFVFVQWCPTHIVLCFCFVFLRLVYPMLPVSLDCHFLIALYSLTFVYIKKTRKKIPHCRNSFKTQQIKKSQKVCDRSLSALNAGTSMNKSGGVKLILCSQKVPSQ